MRGARESSPRTLFLQGLTRVMAEPRPPHGSRHSLSHRRPRPSGSRLLKNRTLKIVNFEPRRWQVPGTPEYSPEPAVV